MDISDENRLLPWDICCTLDLSKTLGFGAWEHYISIACVLLSWTQWSVMDLTLISHTRWCTKLARHTDAASGNSLVIQEHKRMQ